MTVVANVRTAVIDMLKPLLPKTWKLVPFETNLDELSPKTPVVVLKLQSIERHPSAPQGVRLVTYVLTIVEPKIEPGPADDALDDDLIRLLQAIDLLPGIQAGKATRVVSGDHPAYDIDLTFSTLKEMEVTP
jgi:hypothetical protein